MNYDFIISGIKQNEVQHLFGLTEKERKAKGIKKITVNEKPGFPCRVSLADANIGEEIIAFNYEHHKANSPYRSSGPVFVRLNADEARLKVNEIPKMLVHRYLSLRTYNNKGMMIEATTVEGKNLGGSIQKIFSNEKAKYIQVHNARPGCYNCQIDRI
ncbi:MAG: DUF1203 domain-containing protein [Bacteroidota bacterium]